jgi:hypothetical protein
MTLKLLHLSLGANISFDSEMNNISVPSRINTNAMFCIVQCSVVIILGIWNCEILFVWVWFSLYEIEIMAVLKSE